MKRCPKCNDFALYDDTIFNCPLCHSSLIAYKRNNSGAAGSSEPVRPMGEPIRPASGVGSTAANAANNAAVGLSHTTIGTEREPEFETKSGFCYQYRGIVTEISTHTRYHTSFKKWVNSVFRGEPFQFGHSTHETVLRIEEFKNTGLATKKRDLHFYGDVEGRFNIGDDVTVTAKKRGDRYIVTRMYLEETDTRVRPAGIQLSAFVVLLLSILAFMLAASLVSSVVNFFISGAFVSAIKMLLRGVVVVVILWLVLKGVLGRS